MTRSLMAGMTDYSHQSLEDMVADLQGWVKNLTQVCEVLEEGEAQLQEKDYWKKVSYTVKGNFGYSWKFFKTSIEEITTILADFADEIEANHITRIRSLAKTAKNLDRDFAIEWHQEAWERHKDYGNPDFDIVEKMYAEARGMAADMLDLSNLASRLEDFVGKKGKQNNDVTEVQKISAPLHLFVDPITLDELRAIKSPNFDLDKLIRLCEELNICYSNECYLATAMIGRAILDHVPPIFGVSWFKEVCSNYKGGTSFKGSTQSLENSLRNIADHHLHERIRNKESLPTKAQVTFSADLDVLLAEIVRLLK